MERKLKKLLCCILMICMVLSLLGNTQIASAKTKEIYTTLMQKSNSFYRDYVKNKMAVSYKVEIKKKTIVIHGALTDNNKMETTDMGVHTFKLSNNVKYVSRGGEAPEQAFNKKEFKKYLKQCKNSQLALVLEFKKSKVVKVAICS